LLEGKNVNLRIVEKEDMQTYLELLNNPEFMGEFQPPRQWSRAELEKEYESNFFGLKDFFIEKKDGTKIGLIAHYDSYVGTIKLLELAYALLPSERGKGYCTEAIQLMVDYLFLTMDISRVMASPNTRNKASQRVLEKAGFTKEGTIRRMYFTKEGMIRGTARGERKDGYLYSILREEWKEPKILTKT
jgi:RimJ/RimL family protein N-acetyltransferase